MNMQTLTASTKKMSQISTSWYFTDEEDWADEIDYFPGEYDDEDDVAPSLSLNCCCC